MNTALIVEPRDMRRIPLIINHFHFTLGDSWKIVFYCGKGLKEKWLNKVNTCVEIRELDVDNLSAQQYSDILKSKTLWTTLYGEFVLVFQTDAWIVNEHPYTIDYFVKKNVSYIGGNMCYKWPNLPFKEKFCNYNGGLSLRKRQDMITIINSFPPAPTENNPPDNVIAVTEPVDIGGFAEDVYFVAGCYKLNLPLGDTSEDFNLFALHTIYYRNTFFGVHKPSRYVKQEIVKRYPEVQTAYI